MNTYEFWNEMDNIFDAIVAYQEKTIEFNKHFITPWIKLGNVFDKQESNETIVAFKNAIELDPENAQNWFELASAYTRIGDFEKAIQAYQKTVALGFESGELYKNLALAHAMTGQYKESIPLFEKGLALFEKGEDKAVVWNHLGNAYRKLDNYEMALQAFQQADQIESMKDSIVEDLPTATADDESTEDAVMSMDETNAPQPTDEPAIAIENESALEETDVENVDESAMKDKDLEAEDADEEVEQAVEEEFDTEDDGSLPVILELDFSEDSTDWDSDEMPDGEVEEAASEEQPVAEFISQLEQETESVLDEEDDDTEVLEPEVQDEQDEKEVAAEERTESVPTSELLTATETEIDEDDFEEEYVSEENESDDGEEEFVETDDEDETEDIDNVNEATDVAVAPSVVPLTEDLSEELELEENVVFDQIEEEAEISLEDAASPTFSAYEEYLRDNSDSANTSLTETEQEEAKNISMPLTEVEVTNSEITMEGSADLTANVDTKNAHVWNELGNVYFNAGSYDDAITAYRKAIELDNQFAWPYTNLALSYVQQGRLDEAIQLYQRSIELFSSENDKAVAWNRLGNVYRRQNDYEKAIAAYQCADELDADNTAKAQQSRFSLLGSEKVNQEVEYSV